MQNPSPKEQVKRRLARLAEQDPHAKLALQQWAGLQSNPIFWLLQERRLTVAAAARELVQLAPELSS